MKKLLSLHGWLELVGIKDFRKRMRIRNSFHTFIVNLFVLVIILLFMFIPTFLAFGVWFLLSPTDAIARAIIAVGEMLVFGFAQLIFIILGIVGIDAAFKGN